MQYIYCIYILYIYFTIVNIYSILQCLWSQSRLISVNENNYIQTVANLYITVQYKVQSAI